MTKRARIYPPNPKRGHHAETYILSGSGYPKFEARRGWYEVDDETAGRLAKLLNNPDDLGSRPVFQVCTAEEAEALDEVEKEVVADANAPIPMPKKVKENLRAKEDGEEAEWEKVVAENKAAKTPAYIETASDDDLAELEELANADLTSAEVRTSTTKPKPAVKKKTKTRKKARKKAKKKR